MPFAMPAAVSVWGLSTLEILTVLVIEPAVRPRDLPPHPAVALLVVPGRVRLGVEDGLGEGQPLRLVVWGVGEVVLGGQHDRHAPEALVVVPERCRHVEGLVVFVGAGLVQHRLGYDLVVRVVARQLPVVDQGPEHGTGLPPVVVACWWRAGEDAWCLSGFVAVVVLQEVPGNVCCCLFDVVCARLVSRGRGSSEK
jgi:hypothetical protein